MMSVAGVTTTSAMRAVFQPGRLSPVSAPINAEGKKKPLPPPLVVLVHGLESFSGTWDGVMARVAAQPSPSPSILAVDLRGHG